MVSSERASSLNPLSGQRQRFDIFRSLANFALDLAQDISLDSRTIAVRRYNLIAFDSGTEISMEGRLGI